MREAGRALCDRGLGPCPSTGGQGTSEQVAELDADGALVLCPLERSPKLSEHLGLPGHRGAQPGGDGEQMRGDASVEVDRHQRREVVGLDPAALGQDAGDAVHGAVESLDDGVDLGSQAGRHEHDLAQVVERGERREDLVPVSVRDGDGLEQPQGCVVVIHAHRDDCHQTSDPNATGVGRRAGANDQGCAASRR